MKLSLRHTLRLVGTSLIGAALVGGSIFAFSSATVPATRAGASTTPPWEPDPDSVGGLVFYNSSGQVITGGNLSDSPLAAYVEGTTTIRAGDTKATLYGYLPVSGQSTGEWQGEQLGGSTTYPNSSAPAPLNTATLPVETGASGDESIATLAQDFPNNDTSDDGYANMYQLRLRTSAPDETLTTTYDSADIEINSSAGTWTVVYSQQPQTATTTSLSVSPTSTTYGKSVKLTATVKPTSAAGTVDFYDGSKKIGSSKVSSGTATLSTSSLAGGTQKLKATFVPTDSDAFAGSSSNTKSVKIAAAATTTKLSASKTSIKKGTKETLTATLSPSAATGTVTFYDGSKKLGSAKVSKGKATYSTTKLATGSQVLKAKFAPSSTADYESSTSKTVTVKVTS